VGSVQRGWNIIVIDNHEIEASTVQCVEQRFVPVFAPTQLYFWMMFRKLLKE
jgi:hypothetical protein